MPFIFTMIIAAAALISTVILLRKQVNLGLVMLADSIFVVLLTGIPAEKALQYAVQGAVSNNSLKLILLLFLIMMLENIMRNSGMIRNMVDNLKELMGSNRLAACFLPAVLGLLPSPGGARFSCPMVEEVTKQNTSAENKAFINYWFRHVWLDGFILYPGIILAAQLLEMSVISAFLHMLPFMAFNTVLGAVFSMPGVRKERIERTRPWTRSLREFILSLLPVIILIAVYILLLPVTDHSLEIASGGVVLALFLIKRYNWRQIWKTAKEAFPVKLVLIILGVMVFKEILLDSGAINGLPGLMDQWGVPAAVLFLVLPFIGAFTSGITVSYVSMTFPILIPLGLGTNPWYAAIAFTAGSIGCMTTPLHLCAVMSSDYFQSPLTRLLRKVAMVELPLLILISLLLYVTMR